MGWDVSAIGLGTWNIGNQWGNIEESTALETVDAALDNGINIVDTAESYGMPSGLSEEDWVMPLAGRRHNVVWLARSVIGESNTRSRGVLKTTVDMIRLCADASLHRLRTDWHDVLLCHESDIEDLRLFGGLRV